MTHFNPTFSLTVADVDLIESALRETGRAVSVVRLDSASTEPVDLAAVADLDARARQVNDLLGRLHNQKTFFRPAKGTYVGG